MVVTAMTTDRSRVGSDAPNPVRPGIAIVATVIAGVVLGVVLGAPLAAAATILALLPAALVDLREHRLPNRLVGAAAAFGATAVGLTLVARTSDTTEMLSDLLAGATLLAGPLLLAHLLQPAAMGFGDVKAALVLGAATGLAGPMVAIVALMLACAVGVIGGVLARRRTIAFGPALVVGAALALPMHGWISVA